MSESIEDWIEERKDSEPKPYARFYGSDKIHRLKINRITRAKFDRKTLCGRELQRNRHTKVGEGRKNDFSKCQRCFD